MNDHKHQKASKFNKNRLNSSVLSKKKCFTFLEKNRIYCYTCGEQLKDIEKIWNCSDLRVFCNKIWMRNRGGSETLCLFPCLTITTETGSLDTPLALSSHPPPTPQPCPCPRQPTLNKLWSSAAQTAARCHALHPRCQHRVTEADDGLCVPSNTHVSVRDCQIVSNSSHPTRKYRIVQHTPLMDTLRHTHVAQTGSVSWSVWPWWMWISAEALTTQALACQQVCCRWSDALN